MKLPRILIIDDLYGRKPPNRDREDLCLRLGLKDITLDYDGKIRPEKILDPVAEVVFCNGQVETSGVMENDLSGTLDIVRSGWLRWPRWALVLLDLHFKTGTIGADGEPIGRDADRDPKQYFGLTIFKKLRDEFSKLPVVIFSSMDREDVKCDITELGANDFLVRDKISRSDLKACLQTHGLLEDINIVGHSLPVLLALKDARYLARHSTLKILITGKSGTGKELFAKAIHNWSGRKGAFVDVNCAAIPQELIESELFGHEKGAFTGAATKKIGKIELADKGTLFLDEIADMSKSMQAKLLRTLQEQKFERVGGNKTFKVNVRVIAATNKNLSQMIKEGSFRDDLYYRFASAVIHLPPLKERQEDISLLACKFLREAEKANNVTKREISDKAMNLLISYSWPGNVRELQNVINTSVAKNPNQDLLVPRHLELTQERTKSVKSSPDRMHEIPENELYTKASITDTIKNLDSLIKVLDNIVLSKEYKDLYGKLPALQQAYARLLARYLKAALLCPAIRKFSPNKPEGENNITGAMKCLSGQTRLSTSKAADMVKKLLQTDSSVLKKIEKDPILGTAYKEALRLRPKGSKKRKGN
jgi:DNA-binding NtrC family response regulator